MPAFLCAESIVDMAVLRYYHQSRYVSNHAGNRAPAGRLFSWY